MNRETIDFGIDLGTTNSSIALWGSDGQVEIFKDPLGSQSTPSVVHEGRRGLLVGFEAKERMNADAENVFFEFKQQMGRSTTYTFPVSGHSMKPEELSAEVLKSLKGDVQRRLNENVEAAVITIPAAFNKSEIYATNKAAELAGFVASPLCLEPVAAALAYGHQNASKDGFWFVFDFGGGTFDAAIVKLRDEEFQVVNHHGDNYLGGKLIDWAILDQILIPAVQKEFGCTDFTRQNNNPKIQTAIFKLKLATEKAKIKLSTEEKAWVSVEDLYVSESGESHPFDFELHRSDINRMAEPYILRAVNLCREAMKEKRLGPQDMAQLILVGGPTQMPIFREMLADKNVGLGIHLEYSVDPMTVVAQGAAIFARTQKLAPTKGTKRPETKQGEVGIELEYEPAGADEEPVVAGKLLLGEGVTPTGFTIEFSKSDWRSGRIRVTPEGTFMTQLVAERGENEYTIEVQDGTGTVWQTTPKRMSYLRKAMFKEIPLSHSIAVAKADNTVDPLFEKGMPLPLKKMKTYTQTVAVRKDDPQSEINIPLVEGSNELADRNILQGRLIITSSEVKRDVPAGSSIDFTLTVDQSNRLTGIVYVDVLDQEFEKAIELERPKVDTNKIKADARAEIRRFHTIEEQVHEVGDEKAKAALQRIKTEKTLEEVENALTLIDKGGDAEDMLLNRLRGLRLGLDEVESVLAWPVLMKEAEKNKADAEKMVKDSKHADVDDKTRLSHLLKEYDHAIQIENPDLLRRVSSEFDDLYYTLAHKDPGYWVAVFENLRSSRNNMTDQGLANDLFAQGHRSIDSGDVDGLRSAVRQLGRLLPREEAAKIPGLGGTVQ